MVGGSLAVGLGEILWDILPSGKKLGGAPTNFAYHCQAMGARAAVVSAIGDDPLGHEIMQQLESLGLDTHYIHQDFEHPTGTVSVTLDERSVPSYVISQPVAWDFILDAPPLADLAAGADVTCFGSLAQRSEVSRQTIHSFLARTRPQSLRICDINMRQQFFSREIIESSLQLASVLKLNDEELPKLAALLGLSRDEETAIRELIELYELRLVALTRGGNGSSLFTRDEASHHPGFPARSAPGADTVGAGDAFTAAMAIGLLRGETLDRINEKANRLASYVCSRAGATPPVPPELARW